MRKPPEGLIDWLFIAFISFIMIVVVTMLIMFVLFMPNVAHAEELQPVWPSSPWDQELPQECRLYPNSPCLVPVSPRQESPLEEEQRKYQQRQLRIKCEDHPETKGC